jgi:hypothetical protein
MMDDCENRPFGINEPSWSLEKSSTDGMGFSFSLMGDWVLVKKKGDTLIYANF